MSKFEYANVTNQAAVIKVIGVGGGGGNAVRHMVNANMEGVDFIYANTDMQALDQSGVKTTLPLGHNTTKGLGAGANPEIGRQAALEDRDSIKDILEGTDMVFITAGMGGGTGTGAAPIVAQIAKEMNILTVAVVTRPFNHEGKKRALAAEEGLIELSKSVDSLMIVPNDKLLSVLGPDIPLLSAFASANDILLGAVQGISDIITRPGLINVDFADVRTVMSEMGMAMMGSGKAQGEDRARVATEAAINSPLLENVNLTGAKGMLVNVTAGQDLSTSELDAVGEIVQQYCSDNVEYVGGMAIEPENSGDIRVTIVATGLGNIMKKDKSRIKLEHNLDQDPEYKTLEQPTVIRNQQEERDEFSSDDKDYFNIPAFLKKQAD